MTTELGLDFFYKPDQPIASEFRGFAGGLSCLYRKAAETWPGQELSMSFESEGNTFKVNVKPYPPEIVAALREMRNQSDRPI